MRHRGLVGIRHATEALLSDVARGPVIGWLLGKYLVVAQILIIRPSDLSAVQSDVIAHERGQDLVIHKNHLRTDDTRPEGSPMGKLAMGLKDFA